MGWKDVVKKMWENVLQNHAKRFHMSWNNHRWGKLSILHLFSSRLPLVKWENIFEGLPVPPADNTTRGWCMPIRHGLGLAWDTLGSFSLGAQHHVFPGRTLLPLLLLLLMLMPRYSELPLTTPTPICSPTPRSNPMWLESALSPAVVALLVYFPSMSFILVYGKQFTRRGCLSVLRVGWITLRWGA